MELIGIHRQAHRTSGFAPFESCFRKYFVQPLLLGKFLDFGRTGNHQRANSGLNLSSFGDSSRRAQIREPAIRARADERHVDRCA
jgi:hypothetical protein